METKQLVNGFTKSIPNSGTNGNVPLSKSGNGTYFIHHSPFNNISRFRFPLPNANGFGLSWDFATELTTVLCWVPRTPKYLCTILIAAQTNTFAKNRLTLILSTNKHRVQSPFAAPYEVIKWLGHSSRLRDMTVLSHLFCTKIISNITYTRTNDSPTRLGSARHGTARSWTHKHGKG